MYGKLIITRHSLRYDDDHPELFSNNRNVDVMLSNKGADLCITKGIELESLVGKLDIIYVSPFVRAKETGTLLLQSFKEKKNTKIKEMVLLAEGQNKFEPKFDANLINKLKINGMEYPESSYNISKRCKEVIDNIKHELESSSGTKNILLVTHGIIYNYLLKYIYSDYMFVDTTGSGDYVPRCLDMTVLELRNGRFIPTFSDVKNVRALKEFSM